MSTPGHIAALWRYPVKSMGGEQIYRTEVTAHGLAHDRLYAFEISEAPAGMLRVSGSQRRDLLSYRARVDSANSVHVRTPAGDEFPVDDPALLGPRFTLTFEPAPQTDVRPLSLISLQTIRRLEEELGEAGFRGYRLDPRRFRANFYLDLPGGPFAEDALVGRTVRLGPQVTVLVRERDPRCRFIAYDPAAPQATEPLFALMKLLDRRHQGRAGVYASVVTPGTVSVGDAIDLIL